jgi:tRNA A37 threonylcarbamoyladenosine synthetase subunit TsaC/SUA5/YrdC
MASLGELTHFDIKLTPAEKKMLARAWNPHSRRPTSVILPVVWKKAWYLHRGTERFRFRIPRDAALRRLLKKTGPLVAPSANPQGLPTAGNIKEAVAYFGGDVDFYVDGGTRRGRASRLIEIHPDGKVEVIRK